MKEEEKEEEEEEEGIEGRGVEAVPAFYGAVKMKQRGQRKRERWR